MRGFRNGPPGSPKRIRMYMTVNGERYCNACHLYIGVQKHAAFKKPGTDGNSPDELLYYHNRGPGDCWAKKFRLLIARYNGRAA